MKKVILVLTAAFLFSFGSIAPVHAQGANKSGDFTPTNPKTTDASNDHGKRPEDGSVGNADDKNPPGQSKNDKNNGYECDKNNGVGKGNPAHSACASTTTSPSTTTTVKKKDETTTTTVIDTKTRTDAQVKSESFDTQVAQVRGTQVAGVQVTAPEVAAETSPQGLAYTGFETEVLLPLGLLLVALGFVMVKFTAHPKGAHFA